MQIPRVWIKASGEGKLPDGNVVPISLWGWGQDEAEARGNGVDRLKRVLERIGRGEPFPDTYGYGTRPVREEILETLALDALGEPSAVITRNGYGVQVLNTDRLLFLDIDLPLPGLSDRIRQMFGGASSEQKAISRLRDSLRSHSNATFRLYRTAAGLRAIAIDREYDPTAQDVQDLMQATGTDPAYARLCRVQRSFRARLTPKPWRCNSPPPPGRYPRTDAGIQKQFTAWLTRYEEASARHATCRYLETIGNASPGGDASRLIEIHDRTTRCNEPLPLA